MEFPVFYMMVVAALLLLIRDARRSITRPNRVAGANRRWRLQFRCRGSRHESAVAQLFSLGGKTYDYHIRITNWLDCRFACRLDCLRSTRSAGFMVATFVLQCADLDVADLCSDGLGLVFVASFYCDVWPCLFGAVDGQS